MPILGYARVSTDGQTLNAQISELKAAGAERIFREKISGALTDRAQLQRALAALQKGDVLLVTRLEAVLNGVIDRMHDAVRHDGLGYAIVSEHEARLGERMSAWTRIADCFDDKATLP